MEVSELRIGNFVSIEGKECELSKQKFKTAVITLNCLGVEPIPLTEEWLERFGFEKIKSSDFGDFEYHKFINGSEYLVWFSDFSMAIGGSKEETSKGICYCSNCIFEHVHQLQNLYFALTGQELQLKEI